MFQKNQLVEITISDVGSDGEGIGKLDGFTLFIKDSLPGDEILAKIVKLKKNYGYARVEKVIKPSPFRVEKKCDIAGKCGGCQFQHLAYEKQLEIKENKIKNNLIHIGGIDSERLESIFEPIIGAENIYRYRNKAQYPIGKDVFGVTIAGFYANRTHSIIKCEDCILGITENKEILDIIIEFMNEFRIRPYDEVKHTGLIRHVLIRKGFATGEIMVCLVINGNEIPEAETLSERLMKIPGMTSISYSINLEKTNVIMGDNYHIVSGESRIRDILKRPDGSSVEFLISPLSFYQVNPVQTEKLYATALDFAGLTGKENVWDLYCGIGTISLFMAKSAARVFGVEIIPQAIEDAKENAKQNGIENATFFVGAAEEVLPSYYSINSDEMCSPDVIVVDPPRKGCDESCLETIVKMAPEKVVYISCDSATLARDIKYLEESGYEVKRVKGCDLFALTKHVEVVTLLCRQKQ